MNEVTTHLEKRSISTADNKGEKIDYICVRRRPCWKQFFKCISARIVSLSIRLAERVATAEVRKREALAERVEVGNTIKLIEAQRQLLLTTAECRRIELEAQGGLERSLAEAGRIRESKSDK
jgi:DNA primase large subunit